MLKTYTLTISEAQRDKIIAALKIAFPNDQHDDEANDTTSAADLTSMLADMEPGDVTNDFLL